MGNVIQKKTQSIADRAMLVGLTLHRWGTLSQDKKVGEDVATAHGSDPRMGAYQKRLIPIEALADVAALHVEMRRMHKFLTLPWADEGYRILSSAGYFRYNTVMADLRSRTDVAVQAFLAKYHDHKVEAKMRLNGLYREAEYPTLPELKRKFGVDLRIKPIPVADDFRVNVGAENVTTIRKEIEAELETTLQNAMKDVYVRLSEVIGNASERLKKYNVTKEGKVEGRFRDSLVTNITELVDLLPTLNIMGDEKLDAFAARIKKEIAGFTPEQLRDDATARTKAVASADDILKKMQAFVA